jgi:hypothetical protein
MVPVPLQKFPVYHSHLLEKPKQKYHFSPRFEPDYRLKLRPKTPILSPFSGISFEGASYG